MAYTDDTVVIVVFYEGTYKCHIFIIMSAIESVHNVLSSNSRIKASKHSKPEIKNTIDQKVSWKQIEKSKTIWIRIRPTKYLNQILSSGKI